MNTVLGPVPAGQLGLTLVHEHLMLGWPGSETDSTAILDRRDATRVCTERVQELHDLGVRTIVDPSPMELGRDPELAAEVSSASGVHIVIATGLYNQEVGIPYYYRERSIDELAEIFVMELTEGIGSTGIRAGVVKVAAGGTVAVKGEFSEARIGDQEERAHRAAGRASVETGVPILTHNNELAPAGVTQAKIFLEEGVSPERVIIGHAGAVGDLDYYQEVLAAGMSLGFDRFGVESLCPDSKRIASLVGLANSGHLDRLFISTDAVMYWRGRPSPFLEKKVRPRSPHWESRHLLVRVVPQLRQAGVSDDDIRTVLTDNPRRLFGG
ncbi:MAG: phosphotriesterase-related protein [Acidimicrobiia bacterium]